MKTEQPIKDYQNMISAQVYARSKLYPRSQDGRTDGSTDITQHDLLAQKSFCFSACLFRLLVHSEGVWYVDCSTLAVTSQEVIGDSLLFDQVDFLLRRLVELE